MGVVFECKTVVTEILDIISGLGHGPERQEFDGIVFRSVLCRSKQGIQFLGNFLSISGRSHPVAKISDEVAQTLHLLLIRLIMHTIDKSLLGLGDELGHTSVGQKHEFLNKPVGFLGNLLVYVHGLSLLIHFHLHLRSFEAYGSGSKSLLTELGSKTMKNKDSVLKFFRHALMNALGTCLDDLLGIFICETMVGIYHCATEPLSGYPAQRCDLEHSRECQFLLIRTERADLVAEFLWKHRHSPVYQIY